MGWPLANLTALTNVDSNQLERCPLIENIMAKVGPAKFWQSQLPLLLVGWSVETAKLGRLKVKGRQN